MGRARSSIEGVNAGKRRKSVILSVVKIHKKEIII